MEESGRVNCRKMIEEQIGKFLKQQLDSKICRIEKLNEGINSDVYKIDLENQAVLVVKRSGESKVRSRKQRFDAELKFYEYAQTRTGKIPKLLFKDEENALIALEHIKGEKKEMPGKEDIYSMIEFIADLNKNRDDCGVLEKAGEAWDNSSEIIRIAGRRLNNTMRNMKYIGEEEKIWLENSFLKKSINSINKFRNKKNESYWKESNLIKIASPSDIGIHNMINTKNTPYFYDFEYAGCDEITKLALDIVMQPRHMLDPSKEQMVIEGLTKSLNLKKDWIKRYNDAKIITRVIWTTIILQACKNTEDQKTGNNSIVRKAKRYYENYDRLE